MQPVRTAVARIAPYRGTISAIPLYCALWGFWCLNVTIGCDTPPFLSLSPLENMRSGGAIPQNKGCLSATCAIPHENKATWVRYPFCNSISNGYCAMWGGGISHWAAKLPSAVLQLSEAAVSPSAMITATITCFHLNEPLLLKCLILVVASVVKNPTIFILTLFCGRASVSGPSDQPLSSRLSAH